MSHIKTHEMIAEELALLRKQIRVGGIYSHYKNPQNKYVVVDLATQEATEKSCVIYKALYGLKLTFVRDVDSWLEKVEVDGKLIDRFTLTQEKK